MNTIKTIFVAATLLAVGYGTHRVLNGPPNSSTLSQQDMWDYNNVEPGSTGAPGFGDSIPMPKLTPSTRNETNPFPGPNNIGNNPFNTAPAIPPNPLAPPSPPAHQHLAIVPPSPPGNQVDHVGVSPPMTPPPMNLPPATQTWPQSEMGTAPPPPPGNAGSLAVEPNGSGAIQIPGIGPQTTPQGNQTTHQEPLGTSPSLAPAKDVNQIFATTWQKAQSEMGAGELANALGSLSSIYNEPLANGQRSQLVALLDSLAGTVIYSQQSLISPAYTPQPGETIAQIAMRQRVPADFLARVNGINPHQPLDQSIQLKVVTGPFRGELSQSRRELTLFVGPYYAGRFAISIGQEFPAQAQSFQVVEKGGARLYADPRTGQQIAAGHPLNPYGAHWIGLRANGDTSNTVRFGMHSVGESIDVSDARGCVGLSNNDADDLKAILELGSEIRVLR